MSGVSLSLNQRNTQLRGKWSKGMAIDFGQTFSDLFVMCCYCSELRRKNSIPVAASLFLFLPHFLSLSLKHVTVVMLTQHGM